MSYLPCPHCGQKALSVATRCPRCGTPFETQFLRHQSSGPRPSRIPLALLIIGGVAAVLVATALIQGRWVAPPDRPPAAAIVPAPPPEPPRQPAPDSLGALDNRIRPAPPPSPELPKPAPSQAADSAEQAAPIPAPIPAAEPAGTAAGERRYANTWANIRADRRNTAPVLRILHPGEAVLVDSLAQGWYRVVTDPQALGYVDRRFLDATPPAATP